MYCCLHSDGVDELGSVNSVEKLLDSEKLLTLVERYSHSHIRAMDLVPRGWQEKHRLSNFQPAADKKSIQLDKVFVSTIRIGLKPR